MTAAVDGAAAGDAPPEAPAAGDAPPEAAPTERELATQPTKALDSPEGLPAWTPQLDTN